ncbi:MAG TPA: PAS domain S-box protein [Candidatus Methylomirabilis sp.]|nr:PAS domain S-box protein [Candidatus Methylomirabilis sp.]
MSERHIPPRREIAAVLRYGVAVASVAVAVIGTLLLGPNASVGPLYFLAVILSAWFGGGGPGLVTAILGTLARAYFLPPSDSLRVDPPNQVPLLLFLLSAVLVCWLTTRMNRSLAQLERARAELETRVRERTDDLERSNARLRDSEAKLEQAQRIAHVGYWDRDLDTDQVYCSLETYRIYGLAPQEGPLSVSTPWALIHRDDRRGVAATYAQMQQGGARHDIEYRIVTPAGELRTVHSMADVIRDESGRARRLLGMVQDITDRKRVEDTLRAEIAARARVEETLREQAALLDLTHDTVFARDMNDVITYWNRGAEELYGWSGSEVIGKTTHEVIKTIFPSPLPDIRRTLLATGRWEGQLVHTRRDGTQVVVASRWALQRDERGHPVAILETNNDITEQRQAEEALRESEEQWRAVFENNPTMYFMVDAAGTILSVNPFGAEQLGYTIGELMGRSVLDVFHVADRGDVRQNVAACLEQPGRAVNWEVRKIRKDGSMLWVRETARAMVLKGRAVVLVVCEDITERKGAEEERQARRWAVESMDRVNRAIQGTNDLQQMMSDVLEATLAIFDCDRAWLEFPCDPDATSHTVSMQRSRPEFALVYYTVGEELPVDPITADVYRAVRASTDPVRFGPQAEHPLAPEQAKRLGIQSRMAMALYPKSDQPYLFGLSQCSYPRVWTTQEALLFQEIGRRLEDALTSLSIFQRLRESERRYRHIFESTGVSIWEEDFSRVKAAIDDLRSSGVQDVQAYAAAHPQFVRDAIAMVKISDVNEATVKLFGAKSKDELLTSLDRVFLPETERVFREELIAVAEGRTHFGSETVLQTLTGNRLTVLLTVTFPPPPRRPDRVLVTVMDITERKEAEYLTAQVFESSPDRVNIIGTDYRFRRVNPVFERFWGVAPSTGTGMHVADVVGIADFETRVKPSLDRCFLGEDVRWAGWMSTPRGRQYSAITYTPLRPNTERVEAILVIARDLTEHMLAVEALQRVQAELAHVTRVTTMGELASSIAHEVNQPLAAVITNGNAGLRWLASEPPNLERTRTCLTRIGRDAARASEIIARIRKLVKKSLPAEESLNVAEVIQEVLAMADAEARQQEVTMQAQCSIDLPPACGDRIQLQQVILNLVMNAIDAMKSVTDRPRELLIRCEEHEPGTILVAVRDSGIGVDPQGTDRIFDAFYTTKPDGLGMGLSISRSIVEAHGGRLWAVANDDHGATLQFTLPADRGGQDD